MQRTIGLLLVLAIASTAGICTRTTNNYLAPSPVPTPTPAPVANRIEFRVFGSVGNAPVVIRYTNSIDGLTALTSLSLPYVAAISNLDASIFLDLEATSTPALGYVNGSFLQVQIYVDGRLFREAFAANQPTLSVAATGTFRR